MARAPLSFSTSLLLTLSLTACGSGATSGTGGSTASASSSKSGSSKSATSSTASGGCPGATATSSSGAGMMCPGMGFGGVATPTPGGMVSATIVDQTGAAVVGQPIFICGTDVCSAPGKTDASGNASISTPLKEKKPAFKFGDRVAYAELAIPLSMAATTIGTVATAKLPTTGAPLTPGTSATSNGLTIAVPAGATLGFDLTYYACPDQQALRADQVPIAKLGPVLAPINLTPAFEIFYGVSPSETTICPAATVTVNNTPNWPANAKVEFWVMTTDTSEEFAPYGGWAKASDGTVSADGKTVSTDPGAGFIYLDNFGVRLKPPAGG